MARAVPIGVSLALALAVAYPVRAAAPVPIAVAYFDNTSGKPELEPLRKGLADMLITDLAASSDVVLVERARLEAVLAELRLQASAWVDPASARRLGKGLGAAYLLTGAYLVAGRTLRLDVRVIDVETGVVALAVHDEGPVDDVLATERRLAESLLTGLGAKLTLIDKKRLGAGGTRSLDAVRHYGRSLDARDRGDAEAEREALRAALEADPEFARVKARLADLATQVDALERSGGRILRPTSARDHLHNARIERDAGQRDAALAALGKAVAADPDNLDAWVMARALGTAPSRERAKPTVRKLVDAYLGDDPDTLVAALEAPTTRTPAALLLVDLVAPRLPAKTIAPFAAALAAVDALEGGDPGRPDGQPDRLAAWVLDPASWRVRAATLRAAQLGGDRVEQIERRALADFVNLGEDNLVRPSWELFVLTFEPVRDLTLTIEREARHPAWHDRVPDREHGPHRLDLDALAKRLSPAALAAVRAAIDDPNGIVYQLTRDVGEFVPPETEPLAPGALGRPIAVPGPSIRCEASPTAVTGRACRTSLYVPFAALAPGLYRLTLAYRDADGRAVRAVIPAWARETKLVRSRGPGVDHDDPWHNDAWVHPVAPGPIANALRARLISTKPLEPAFAILALTWFRTHVGGERGPHPRWVARLAWDVDWASNGGVAIAEDDFAAWRRYRDRLLAHGWALAPDVDRDIDYLPLPALTPGEHTLCLATERADGSRSPEAECTRIEVPATR